MSIDTDMDRTQHDRMIAAGYGVRAVTPVKSTAYRSAAQARGERRDALVLRSSDGWYTVYSRAC